MTRLAQTERTDLCDLALQVGEEQPTLCGDWTVKDLLVHLALREGGPAAAGILVPALAGLTARATRRLEARDFTVLVERVRQGPPLLSPFAVPPVDAWVNALEFFVHHEDVRRAQPGWMPRVLGAEAERTLWARLRPVGRALTRAVPTGVRMEDVTTGASVTLRPGTPSVTVRGLPSELALYLFGRREQAQVDLFGDQEAVDRLGAPSLGL